MAKKGVMSYSIFNFDKRAKKQISGFLLFVYFLSLFSFVIGPITNVSSADNAFTITEYTVYDILENTIYVNITENLDKPQYINISHIFDENILTSGITYKDVLIKQNVTENITGTTNVSQGKYKTTNQTCVTLNLTESCVTNYYDDAGVLMSCSYVLGDKSCLLETSGVIGTRQVETFLPLPGVKQKIVVGGLKIEQKQEGIPLPKSSKIQLKLTYSHPIATIQNKPTEIQNKYDIKVSSTDGLDYTILDPTWYNVSWGRRKSINISEQSGGTLTNHETNLNITYDSDMYSNFADLRFVANDDVTALTYMIDSEYTVNSNYASVWVKMPSLSAGANTTIYMYYKNSSAVSTTSDPENTFQFYDNFNDASFNTSKWTDGSSGTVTESTGNLTITYGGSGWKSVYTSKVFNFTNDIWEVRITNLTMDDNEHILFLGMESGTTADAGQFHYWKYTPNMFMVPYGNNGGRYDATISIPSIIGSLVIDQNRGSMIINGVTRINDNNWTANHVNYYVPLNSRIHLAAYGNNQVSVSYDWVRLRNYVATAPLIYYSSEETSNNAPTLTANATSPATVYTNTDFKVNLTATDPENGYLNVYTQFYNNNALNGSLQYFNLTNNTNQQVALLGHGNFTKGNVLIANIILGDGTVNNTAVNLTSKTVANSAPTIPTGLSLTSPVKVSETLTATGSGSTDADSDALTYYYQFYNTNSSTELQAYSTDNTYVIQTTDSKDLIRVRTKSYDGTAYSSEYEANRTVSNTAPTLPSALNFPGTIYVTQSLSGTCGGSTDADSDAITYNYKFYNVDSSTTLQDYSTDNSYVIQVSDSEDTIRVSCIATTSDANSSALNTDVSVWYSSPEITTTIESGHIFNSKTITFNFTVTSPIDLINASLRIDSSIVSTNTSGIQGDYLINYTVASDGDYTWRVIACNAADCLTSGGRDFYVDTTSPELSIITPTNTTYNNRTQLLNISATDTYLDTTIYNYNGTNYTYTIPLNVLFAEGSNTLLVWANDTAGNWNSSSVVFNIDSIKPVVSIIYPEDLVYMNTPVDAITYTATDIHLDKCWYSIDNGVTNISITTCNNLTGLTAIEGANNWTVYANDTYGNIGQDNSWFTKYIGGITGNSNAPEYIYLAETPYKIILNTNDIWYYNKDNQLSVSFFDLNNKLVSPDTINVSIVGIDAVFNISRIDLDTGKYVYTIGVIMNNSPINLPEKDILVKVYTTKLGNVNEQAIAVKIKSYSFFSALVENKMIGKSDRIFNIIRALVIGIIVLIALAVIIYLILKGGKNHG